MAEYCGTRHHHLECGNEDLVEYLFKAVDARDLPCMADVESSMLYFCSSSTFFISSGSSAMNSICSPVIGWGKRSLWECSA